MNVESLKASEKPTTGTVDRREKSGIPFISSRLLSSLMK